MKKKFLAMALTFTMLFGLTTAVSADATPTVSTDEEGNLSVDHFSFTAFEGMAPGDSREQTITVTNNNTETMYFYVSEDTLQALEETNDAAGGAYTFDMKVGDGSYEEATSLLSAVAGGYSDEGQASKTGLSDVDGLSEESGLLAVLEPGESTNLYVCLTLNGEGNDREGYANALGKLQFNFSAETVSHSTTPRVIQRIHKIVKNNKIYKYVKTGDRWTYLIYLGILLCGIVIAIVGFKKRKAKED